MKSRVALLVLVAVPAMAAAPVNKAVAIVSPLGTSGVSGKVLFARAEGGVKVDVELVGLKPGVHGFHIHEFGDCSAADGTSAGGHFNPTGEPHAGPQDSQRHAGDMGNIEATADGKAILSYLDTRVALEGPNGILGRGIIVHAQPDDLKTQPTGNAGGRLACGVIGAVKAE
jgi:Cu-Zn family superoxide dismutase